MSGPPAFCVRDRDGAETRASFAGDRTAVDETSNKPHEPVLLCGLCLDETRRGGHQVDENVVEEIRLHQETIAVDNNTPLHLIREKELEISGRVLSAKREADEIVSSARKKAAEVVSTAEAEGGTGAADREKVIREEAAREATRLREDAHLEASRLGEQVEKRRDEAIRLVLDAVTTV
jgi:vacuolar-type H+-ATPase subunit H